MCGEGELGGGTKVLGRVLRGQLSLRGSDAFQGTKVFRRTDRHFDGTLCFLFTDRQFNTSAEQSTRDCIGKLHYIHVFSTPLLQYLRVINKMH